MTIYDPVITREFTPEEDCRVGTQKIYRFENGYGASVVRFKISVPETPWTMEYGSYGADEGLWELAVIKFKK